MFCYSGYKAILWLQLAAMETIMDTIRTVIEDTINEAVLKNSLDFKEPLIGYANPNDPLFLELKKLHPHHLMPRELKLLIKLLHITLMKKTLQLLGPIEV